jgi:adenosylcobinamide-phosphate synthase
VAQARGYHQAMSFFAILCALLIEQIRPLPARSLAHEAVRGWADWVCHNIDAGRPQLASLAWVVAVGMPTLAVLAAHLLLDWMLGWPFAVAWNVAVLYLTLGFRQFSHPFTQIREALDAGDEVLARALLAKWRRIDAELLPRSEVVRLVIEHSVVAAHRHVFGVLAWHSMLAALGLGPSGAVFYRMAEFLRRRWDAAASPASLEPNIASLALSGVATDMWHAIDWLPARITALGFAVVGSFEDAIDRWRQHARKFPTDNDGLMLAATSGALNVRLGATTSDEASGAQTNWREPQLGHLAQLVGLVWRTVVMWMVLLALLTLAHLLG